MSISTSTATILIIEDELPVRQLIAEIVESVGHKTLCAPDGQEGLRIYQEQPKVDLVITDIVMPQKDGVETIRALKNHNPKAKVIAVTGYRGQYNRLPAAEYVGADKTLIKPFSKADLLSAVELLLNTG